MILIPVLVLFCLLRDTSFLVSSYLMGITSEAREKVENTCLELVAEPDFKEDSVIGTIWTSYYTWDEDIDQDCLLASFEKTNDGIKRRYENLMKRYIRGKIEWSKATLQITMNATGEVQQGIRRMLLIPVLTDRGANVGLFQSIPRVPKNERLMPHVEVPPKVSMALKLYKDGRYLIMADCITGFITLLVRRDQKHTWKEIDEIVNFLKFDASGYPACKYSLRKRIDNKL